MDEEDIINLIALIISIICFIQSLAIEIIQINQDNLRKGFFNVVFLINTFECILYLSFFLETMSLYFKLFNENIYLIFAILFFFSNIEIISYNIFTLSHLLTSNIKNDTLIDSDMENKKIRTYSISLKTHSFSKYHIFSFLISFFFTCLNFYNALWKNLNFKSEYWFFLFYKKQDNYYKLIFIIIFIIYLILSIPYFIISKNTEEISEKIKLKNYSLYCLLSSFLLLIFSTSQILFLIMEFDNNIINILKLIYGSIYLLILLISFWYRSKLYYVSLIIYEGNNLIKRIINCFEIIFCIRKIKPFASIDYNNAFLLHALASKQDFMIDEDLAKSFDQSISYN